MSEDRDYTDLAVRLEQTHSMCESHGRRIDSLEAGMRGIQETQIALVKIGNSVENMGQSIVSLNEKVDDISDKQDEFKDKLVILENQPAQNTKRRVDDILEKVAWVLIGGTVAWILGHLFPNVPW